MCDPSLILSAVCAASRGSPPPTTIASESLWPWNATIWAVESKVTKTRDDGRSIRCADRGFT
jgi:hypothetical protein